MIPRNLGSRFTLVSYNILSQTLLNDHIYLYTNCNPRDLEWPRRGQRIVSELIRNRADIICLQEVEKDHLYSLYRPRLAKYGYECLYKKKTGYKIDGCAIFYKTRLFQLLDHKGVEFNRTDLTSILNRDNVGIIAVFKPMFDCKLESSQLVIANTHLIFNPRRSDIKLAQLKYFLTELEKLSLDHNSPTQRGISHHPTILCGDLNSVPDSDVTKFITKNLDQTNVSVGESRSREYRESKIEEDSPRLRRTRGCLEDLDHSLKFKSVYPSKNRRGELFVSNFSHCIVDYIFYNPRLRLESFRELLTETELRDIGAIPNSEFPSDHLNLEAEFSIK